MKRILEKDNRKTTTIIDFRTNFCGPYWSDGKFQSSVKHPTKEPVNAFDYTCRDHDVELATATTTSQVLAANTKFYDRNYGQGIERSLAAVLVRYFYPFNMPSNKKQNKNLRGSEKTRGNAPNLQQLTAAIKQALPPPKNNKKKPKNKVMTSTSYAPVSIGTTVRGVSQSISYSRDSVVVSGRDFICSVGETAQTNWYLGALIPINPIYFTSTTLGRLGQSFRYYRFKKLVAHFVTRQPTSSTGEIIMSHHPNAAKESFLSAFTGFLPTVMSAKDALMGPVWTNHSLPLKVSDKFMEVDSLGTADIDDNILGELMVYVQSSISDVVGYVLFEYVLEFKDMYVNEHAPYMPLVFVFDQSRSDDTADPVAGAQMLTLLPANMSSYSQGTVFKAVLNSTGTTYGTGSTANTALKITNRTNAGTLALTDGVTFWCVIVGTSMMWYPTLESALSQTDSVYVSYGVAATTRSSWYFTYWVAQWGPIIKT